MTINEKQFNATIKAIKTNSDTLAQAIHTAGLFAIAQANEHGNVGFGVRLIEAMGKKHDSQRVCTWLCRFGKFGVSKGVLVYRKRKDIDGTNLESWLAKAEATPYWELTPQKALVEKVDYLSMLHSIINKHKAMEKKQAEGKEVVENNVGILAEVEKLLAKFSPSEVKQEQQLITL